MMQRRIRCSGLSYYAEPSVSVRARRPCFESLEERRLLTGGLTTTLPYVSIGSVTVMASSTVATAATFTVSLSSPSGQTAVVDYATADGTALAGRDYVATSGTLDFTSGQTRLSVVVQVDAEPPGPFTKSFSVNLTVPADGNALIAPVQGQGLGTIVVPETLPSVSIAAATATASATGATAMMFTVTLSAPANEQTTVDYATVDGTAVSTGANPNYVDSTGTLTFATGQTTQKISVPIDAAPDYDVSTSFTVTLSNPTNALIQIGQATGTIENPNSAPTVSISANPSIVVASNSSSSGNSYTGEEDFLVSLSAPSNLPTTVTYGTADGTATANVDYVPIPPTTLTFAPGQTQQTVAAVAYLDPSLTVGQSLSFTVNLLDATNATLAGGATTGTGMVLPYTGSGGTGTVNLNPVLTPQFPPYVAISAAQVTAAASGPTDMTFMVNLSHPSGQTVVVDYATANGTATSGVDYEAAAATALTFLPNQTERTITIVVDAEPAYALPGTFTVNLSNPTNGSIETGQATGTILDPSTLPALSISPTTAAASPSNPVAATFTVRLSAPSALPVTVAYSTADGTATAGVDYVAVPLTTLTFPPSQTKETVTVPVAPEPQYDLSRTFMVNLSNPAGASIAAGQATGTIVNPNTPPAIAITGATVHASADGATTATFPVRLSAPSDLATTVTYATADGTATAGVDYVAIPPTTLTFAPGQTEQDVTVTINSEPAFASTRTFTIDLTDPTGAVILTGQATATIVGSSSPPAVSITGTTVTASPSTTVTATFVVTLSEASSRATSVTYATADGTAAAGVDYVAVPPTTLTFAPDQTEQTITVTVDAARGYDLTKTFTVNLTALPQGNATVAAGQATGTIENPDPYPTVSVSGAMVTAAPGGSTAATFTVSLSVPSDLPAIITYGTDDGTAVAGRDYVAIPIATVTIAPGQTAQTITVDVNAEAAGTPSRTFTINLLSANGAIVAGSQGVGTINASPNPTPPPTLTGHMFTTSGKGKKRTYRGQLFFSAALDAAAAQITSNYHITQSIRQNKTANVPVRTATYSAATDSVTLILSKPKPGKALQAMVSGLLGAGGAAVGGFTTKL